MSFIDTYREEPGIEPICRKLAVLRWVDWLNNHRLLGRIGHIPPAEAEANHHADRETIDMVA